ncbi:MAG: hypothetical protein GXP47_03640 [Acidobacteria bacterium]|nr:hypothetical protein [Acidobacteriota bacterium]
MNVKMWRATALLATAGVLTAGAADAQLRWVKDPSNPVMVHAVNVFEVLAIGQPAVLAEDGTLRLWYSAAGIDHRGRILAARSTDGGLSWQREKGGWPVLDVGAPGTWDSFFLDTPEVVHDDGGYRLYYYGSDSAGTAGASIGLATSTDGLHFERHGSEPVLGPGPAGSWDGAWIESPAVLFDAVRDLYLMWYTGIDGSGRVRIGLATSTDGIAWDKSEANPVLDLGPAGSWEDAWVGVPGVIRWRDGFLMAYSAVSATDLADGTPDDIGVGLAFSQDGVTWHRLAGNPVLRTTSPPHDPEVDASGPWAPDLAWDSRSHRFLMLYESAAGFNLAVSTPELARHPRARAVPRRTSPPARPR